MQLVTGVSDLEEVEIWKLGKKCKWMSGRLEKIKATRSCNEIHMIVVMNGGSHPS